MGAKRQAGNKRLNGGKRPQTRFVLERDKKVYLFPGFGKKITVLPKKEFSSVLGAVILHRVLRGHRQLSTGSCCVCVSADAEQRSEGATGETEKH